MEKLTGLKKIKTAVFISGTGSNLKNIIKFSKIKKSPISINLIISNTCLAKGLKYAEQFKIKKKIFNFKDYNKHEILNINVIISLKINKFLRSILFLLTILFNLLKCREKIFSIYFYRNYVPSY